MRHLRGRGLRMHLFWRGGVEAWECDEMGHMNVRFWVKRAMDGFAVLAARLGCARAFAPGSPSTFLPADMHIRFLREAAAGTPLFLRGGVAALGADELTFYGEIVRTTDEVVSATFIVRMAHVQTRTGERFALSSRLREAAGALRVDIPAHAQPRSIPLDRPLGPVSRAGAVAAGMAQVGLSPVRAQDVDVFGRLLPEGPIGRVSEAVPNLMARWRGAVAAEAEALDGAARRAGAAVLEYRLMWLDWPRAGDLVEVLSGVTQVMDKTHVLQHWLVDPLSGRPWCACEALAITFDLVARRAISTPPQARAALEAMKVSLPAG